LRRYLLVAFVLQSACNVNPGLQTCPTSDLRVGQTADLIRRSHGVSGLARNIDNCTILLENFSFDGIGNDVRVIAADNPQFINYTVLSHNLVRAAAYDNETLTLALPEGVSLADTVWIAVFDVTLRVSLGDGQFQ
jgi:hypothetical protein